jgi:cytochrome P450
LNLPAKASDRSVGQSGNSEPACLRRVADLPGPKGVPLLGNMLQFDAMQGHLTLENWARKYGSMYKFHAGRQLVVVISDNALIAGLLRDRPDALRRGSRLSDMLTELGTSGVFTHEGDEWRKQRKLVMRALTPEVIRQFFPTMVSMTERLRHRWQTAVSAGKPIDMLRDLKAFTLDVTIGLAMGCDINALEHHDNPLQRDIEQVFNRVGRRLTSPLAYWRYLKLPVDRAADASAERIAQAVAGFIAKTRKELEVRPERRTKPSNMLEALIAARDEPDSGFTDEHVIGNAVTMVFAGEDTTSNSIAWLLDFVARHPPVAANIAREADAVLGDQQVLREYAGLEQFPYTDAAVNEAMRLKPVAPVLSLGANQEMIIGDTFVPQGTQIITCLRHSGQLANDFPESGEFRPERWFTDDQAIASDDPTRKLFPFGGGPRFCPGRYLALAEIKMVMSMVARNFRVSFDREAPPVKELFTFTMAPSVVPITLALRE